MADPVMKLTPKQLHAMTLRIKSRARGEVAEEIDGFAAIEDSLGNTTFANRLREIAEGFRPASAGMGAGEKVPLTPERVQQEASRLIVPGMERLPFPGYDAPIDDGLPPMREHSDDDDIAALVRRIGA